MMAKESDPRGQAGTGLDALQAALKPDAGRKLPPIHLWDPPFCGDIDMRIARDGTWFYNDSPIGRPALVALFSSVLRKEGDRFVLVTPVEKVGIVVEDAPFMGVEMRVFGEEGEGRLSIRTNVDEWIEVDAEHPLRFEPGESGGLKPYVRVRGELWALIKRSLFYDLVERSEVRRLAGEDMFGVMSAGIFFPMAAADTIGLSD